MTIFEGKIFSKYHLVRQYDQIDCGPASLLTILRYYGGNTSLPKMREMTNTTIYGSTMLDLVNVAKKMGFDAYGATGEYEDLMKEKMPCIAHVVIDDILNHFVVVYKIGIKKIKIGDPAKGIYTLTRQEFEKMWKSKSVILLKPTNDLLNENTLRWHSWLSNYIKKDSIWLMQSIFLGIVFTILGLLTSLFIQKLIDKYIPEKNNIWIYYTAFLLLILLIIRSISGYIRDRFMVILNKRLNVNITGDFFNHLFYLPKKFFDTRKRGDITARIHDIMRIQQAVLQIGGITIIDILIIIGSLLLLFYFSTTMALMALIIFPLYGVILLLSVGKLKNQQNEVMKGYALVESNYIDTLSGMDEIKSFNTSDFFANFNKMFYDLFQSRIQKLGFTQAKLSLYAELSSSFITVGMLLFGAVLIISGKLLLGEMMAAYSLTIGALPSINRLINANISLQSANIAVTRLMDMLLIEREKSESTRKFQLKNKIKIEDAEFSWDGRNYLFENISLDIPIGRITSLWGPSGSGKSTLVQLIQRKYLLNKGKILIDEINANEFDLIDYRNNIGVVPQEIKIFNGTLADNILVGRTIQNYNFLIDVIDELNLSSFLRRFNYGLYTMLGENGRKLSGGEMQMLALIRALLFKPRVLIIDEGLSGIDFELEELIFNTIRNYSKNNAVLLITHNIMNLMRTDYLYVIRNCRIEEHGSPDLLIKNGSDSGV